METNFLFKLWIIIKLCLYYVQSKVVRNILVNERIKNRKLLIIILFYSLIIGKKNTFVIIK